MPFMSVLAPAQRWMPPLVSYLRPSSLDARQTLPLRRGGRRRGRPLIDIRLPKIDLRFTSIDFPSSDRRPPALQRFPLRAGRLRHHGPRPIPSRALRSRAVRAIHQRVRPRRKRVRDSRQADRERRWRRRRQQQLRGAANVVIRAESRGVKRVPGPLFRGGGGERRTEPDAAIVVAVPASQDELLPHEGVSRSRQSGAHMADDFFGVGEIRRLK